MKRVLTAAALAAFALAAQAQTYGELGFTALKFKALDEGDTFKSSPTAIRAVAGYELHPNLAVEGLLALGLTKGSVKGPDVL